MDLTKVTVPEEFFQRECFSSKVKSRYRTGTFKHRPPVEKISSQVTVQQKQHRLDDKRSLVLLRNTPVVTPINEDNIQTMIQYENERVEGEESEKEVLVEKDEAEVEEEHNTTFFVEPRSQVSELGRRKLCVWDYLVFLKKKNLLKVFFFLTDCISKISAEK